MIGSPQASSEPGRPAIEDKQAIGIELTAADLAVVAADAIHSKQGSDIVILDVGDLLGVVDLFVIGSGTSKRQIRTIVEEVDQRLGRYGRDPLRTEGLDTAEWVLADYGDLAVHVFAPEQRSFYALERLWGDAPRLEWEPPSPA